MPNHRSTEIANEFLRQPGALGSLTQMQIQKLVFIANGFSLALSDEPLVVDDFEAWDYGPVEPELRRHTVFYGGKPITRLLTPSDGDLSFFFRADDLAEPYRANLNNFERKIIENVYQRYGGLSAMQLSKLTHQPDTPWHRAYAEGRNRRIRREDIADHYRCIVDNIAA